MNRGNSENSPKQGRLILGVWLAGLIGMALLAGCSSMNSKTGGSHGAITIEGYSFSDVVLTTRDVFEDYGYRLSKAEPDHMSFDRPGTRADQIKYGSFGSSGVVIRVKVDIQEMGIETYFLRCDVYSVRDAGDPVLEDESKIIMVSSKPYQEMLEEVQARLKAKIAPH